MVDLRLDKMSEIIYDLFMSESTALLLKTLGGIITGLLVSSGHLDVGNQDAFSQNINTMAGAVVTILSAFYLLEHAFQSAKEELKWAYKPEDIPVKTVTTVTPAVPSVPTKTVTTVTPVIPVETPVIPPAQPTA